MKLRQLSLALSLVGASTVGLVGCGGSSNDYPEIVSLDGKAIDGYLVGARVCVDVNRNKQCDDGEPFDITDEGGNFDIETSDTTSPLVLESTGETYDTDDGPSVTIPEGDLFLTAPAGAENVTPLTTLVQVRIEVEGLTEAEAQEEVIEDLGLTDVLGADGDLGDFDYVAAQQSDDADLAEAAEKAAVTAEIITDVIKENIETLQDADEADDDTSFSVATVVTTAVYDLIDNDVAEEVADAVEAAVDAGLDLDDAEAVDTLVDDTVEDSAATEDDLTDLVDEVDDVLDGGDPIDDDDDDDDDDATGGTGGTGAGSL